MSGLDRYLRERILRHGPISIAEFMAAALTHPRFGYYMGKDPLGVKGDFITAPEISQMFGELIGAWAVAAWRQMGGPETLALVELGPGRGTLMSDALRAARTAPDFLAAATIHLVETSPAFEARQRQALAGYRANWHRDFEDVPSAPLIVIANEFFDALPIQQYVFTEGGWRRRCVGIDDETHRLCFVLAAEPLDDPMEPNLGDGAIGDIRETSPMAVALMASIARRLRQHRGTALIIDYGAAKSAPGDSLQAVKGHASHRVLDHPGEADITAHVDFEALANAAAAQGCHSFGPLPQGIFLKNLGIEARKGRLLEGADAAQARDIRSAYARLTSSAAMGTLFKALGVASTATAPPGFEPPS